MPMRIGTPMPALDGATEWISGSAEEALKETEGHPLLLHFWSLSCGMCKENLPRVAEWREKYRDAGLRMIAIHMPRYPTDTDVDAVREAVSQYGIIDPSAIDNPRTAHELPGKHLTTCIAYGMDSETKLARKRHIAHICQPDLGSHRGCLAKAPLRHGPRQNQPQQITRTLDLSSSRERPARVCELAHSPLAAEQRHHIRPLELYPLTLIHPLFHALSLRPS